MDRAGIEPATPGFSGVVESAVHNTKNTLFSGVFPDYSALIDHCKALHGMAVIAVK
jgi:hypothetical protein